MNKIKKNTTFFLSAISLVFFCHLFTNKLDKNYIVSSGIDSWEYHSVAVNFAAYNEFPLMGIYETDSIYQFHRFHHSEVDDYKFCRWYESGFIYSFEKPPLYPLTLGLCYKIFGVKIDNVYFLNLLFLTFSIYFIFLIGNQLFQRRRFFSFAAAILYLLIGEFGGLSAVSPNLLLTCFVLGTIYYILKGRDKTDLKFFMGLGILFALMSMTKGNIIFFILLYPLFLLIQFGINERCFKTIAILFFFFIVTISPWMIYANTLKVRTSNISKMWGEKMVKSEKNCQLEIDDFSKINNDNQHYSGIIQKNCHHKLLSYLWTKAYSDPQFITLSNQFRPEEFLSVHNEYSISGMWMPEWRFIDSSYYNNNYLEKPLILKIVHFYLDHPRLLFEIIIMKFKEAVGTKFSIYCFSILLLGIYLLIFDLPRKNKKMIFVLTIVFFLCLYYLGFAQLSIIFSILMFALGVMLYRKKHINAIHYSFILLLANSLIFTIIVYGARRFVYFIDPISIIVSLMIIERIFLEYQKPKKPLLYD